MVLFVQSENDHGRTRVIPWSSIFPDEVYALGRIIGRGSIGNVHECFDRKSGKCLACKIVRKDGLRTEADRDDLRREMQISRLVGSHPNIVSLVAVHEDESAVYFVVERCYGGDLLDHINRSGRVPETEAAFIFSQLVGAVSFCHKRGVIHRDLKPENVMLTCRHAATLRSRPCTSSSPLSSADPSDSVDHSSYDSTSVSPEQSAAMRDDIYPNVKLTDFGLAVQCRKGGLVNGSSGSLPYKAPEILCNAKYSNKVDVWSLGIILYTMLAGRWPFCACKKKDLCQQIRTGQIDVTSGPWRSISREAKNLLRSMLAVNPSQRPTCEEILQHSWLVKLGSGSVSEPRYQPVNFEGSSSCSRCATLKGVEQNEHHYPIHTMMDLGWNQVLVVPGKAELLQAVQSMCDEHLNAVNQWWFILSRFMHRKV